MTMKKPSLGLQIAFIILPIIISLIISAILVALVGRDPIAVFQAVLEGAFRNERAFTGVLNFFIPLTLVSIGLVVTFRAGLWNIGIEGQMMAGAIAASIIPMYILQNDIDPTTLSPPLLLLGSIFLAMLAGLLWAGLVGVLKTWLGVNEIFGGVALNALIDVFSIYMISGPWEPAIGGSAQMTERFPPETLYPEIAPTYPTSALGLVIVAVVVIVIFIALQRTRWGLNLKAVGKNARSALLLGVPTNATMMSAFLVCGALAGIAGSYRTLFTYDSLRPLASGGIGFLGLLVVLLIGIRALWVPLISFGFAVILAGSTRLRISMQLDASLAGVLQGTLVLLMLLFNGVRQVYGQGGDDDASLDATVPEAGGEVLTS
jgi:ABC-type uncharacterized transport system permease subunit